MCGTSVEPATSYCHTYPIRIRERHEKTNSGATGADTRLRRLRGGNNDAGEENQSDEPISTQETTGESSSEDAQSLADFFGYGTDDPEAQQAEFRDQEARVQEAIRRCMAEQGFDYQPVLPPDSAFQVYGPEDEEERVRTQGFGITTWFGNEDQMDRGEEWVDPNQDALEEMSDSEREAWQEALHGTQEEQEELMELEVDEETGETVHMMTGFGPGCYGEAQEAEYGDMNQTQELWEQLQPAMDQMHQRVEADPRIIELNEEWSSCMAEAGYEVESRNDMYETVYQDFQERFDELVGAQGGFSDPFEGWSQEEIDAFFEENTQEEIDAFFEEAQETARAEVDMEAVEALQQEEIDMAVANFECSDGWQDAYTEISQEYEADLIAENREILEQIREAQGG